MGILFRADDQAADLEQRALDGLLAVAARVGVRVRWLDRIDPYGDRAFDAADVGALADELDVLATALRAELEQRLIRERRVTATDPEVRASILAPMVAKDPIWRSIDEVASVLRHARAHAVGVGVYGD